jgi:hypothetical protein
MYYLSGNSNVIIRRKNVLLEIIYLLLIQMFLLPLNTNNIKNLNKINQKNILLTHGKNSSLKV